MKTTGVVKFLSTIIFISLIAFSALGLPFMASAQVSGLTSPEPAEAQFGVRTAWRTGKAIKSMYDIWCGDKEFAEGGDFECETHRGAYIASMVNDLVVDVVMLAIWGKTSGDVFAEGGEPPFKLSEYLSSAGNTEYAERNAEILANGRIPNGAAGMIGSTYLALSSEPPVPTNMALFLNDSVSDTMFGTPAFAADFVTDSYKVIILRGWRIARNIALSLLGVVLAVVGLMIIFRTKIAPQVSVSIYNVLPTLPIAIALIVLSYPIISLALSAVYPLMQMATAIGREIVGEFIQGDAAGVFSTANSLGVSAIEAQNAPYYVYKSVSEQLGGPGMAVSFLFMIVAFLLAVTVGLFYFLWNMAKIYMSFIMVTIVAPFVLLLSILPGKQGLIMNLGKRILVDVISLPLMIVGAYVAFALIIYTPTSTDLNSIFPGWSGVVAGTFIVIPLIIKGFIGVGFLFQLRKVRSTLESSLGVTSLFGAGDEKRR